MGVAATITLPGAALARPRHQSHRSAAGRQSWEAYLGHVRALALANGIPASVINAALAMAATPNQAIIKRDHHQPEFTMTWAQYKARVVNPNRISQGQQAWAQYNATFNEAVNRYGASPVPILGIWGLESGFGRVQGKFNVISALATLAWEGRRAKFFTQQLLDALRMAAGGVNPATMMGSYAGAMGQPQFMPSAYLHYATSMNGQTPANIWTSVPDVLASVANYLAKSGWQAGMPWGWEVTVPPAQAALPGVGTGWRNSMARPVSAWEGMGVRPVGGLPSGVSEGTVVKVIQPDGPGGQAYAVTSNFKAIRAYNPSDYYALAVGILGDSCITR
ncbi:lytic murein transglycosylase [Formicincola oecophyllae]|uniref:Lytic murein transglycosylase n=2 Tax=Formicincola oecophyllae TaxID=2558361 RepID=A0A4Y6U9X1_9PROT|nr:lytic murein transglycosylase [Formicincola oecophyllae]